MRTYRCRVVGNNFVLMTDDGPHRLAFYGARDISAERPEDAEQSAVEQIWLELSERLLNPAEDPPSVTVESVIPLTGKAPAIQPFTWISEQHPGNS